jgi:hypothetical protein
MTASFLIFHIAWSIIGIYWCCQDDACRDINPRLALSVGIMCSVMLVYVTLSQISQLQLARLVRLITQDDADRAHAAAAARLAGCVSVELDDAGRSSFDGQELPSDCPICMDALMDESAPTEGNRLVPGVVQTPCGHIFHESCLKHWASRSGTCPLCRTDLSSATGSRAGDSSSGAAQTAELQQLLLHLERYNPERAEVTRTILGVRGP